MSIVTATYNESANTMDVTYRGETRTFRALPIKRGEKIERVIANNVMSAKFRSGNKLWPASVTLWASGNAVVDTAGFSNKGGARIITGWWNDESNHNSQHNGAR